MYFPEESFSFFKVYNQMILNNHIFNVVCLLKTFLFTCTIGNHALLNALPTWIIQGPFLFAFLYEISKILCHNVNYCTVLENEYHLLNKPYVKGHFEIAKLIL